MESFCWGASHPAMNPSNSSVLSIEAVSPHEGYSQLWEKSVVIPGMPGWSPGNSGLYADATGLTMVAPAQSKVFYVSLLSNGTLRYSAYLPGLGFSGSIGEEIAILNGAVFYLEGSETDPKVYGVRLADGGLVANFSAIDGVKAYGSVNALYPGDHEILTANNLGVTAYSPEGNKLWSYQVQNGSSLNYVFTLVTQVGLTFLEEDNSHVYYSFGQLYSASYAIVNSSSGRELWHATFEPWVLPPWTDRSFPHYGALGTGEGFLLFTDGSYLYGVQIESLI